MAVLVLGAAGMQGQAVLHDLSKCESVPEIIAADSKIDALMSYLKSLSCDRIRAVKVDATNQTQIANLMKNAGEVIIDSLPMKFTGSLVRLAVNCGINLVSVNYIIVPSENDFSKTTTL